MRTGITQQGAVFWNLRKQDSRFATLKGDSQLGEQLSVFGDVGCLPGRFWGRNPSRKGLCPVLKVFAKRSRNRVGKLRQAPGFRRQGTAQFGVQDEQLRLGGPGGGPSGQGKVAAHGECINGNRLANRSGMAFTTNTL